VSPADLLAAARVCIDKSQRILSCIVANRNLVSPSLQRAIERLLVRPRTLLQIERGDAVLVRTVGQFWVDINGVAKRASDARQGNA
jgi:hypothetical protein